MHATADKTGSSKSSKVATSAFAIPAITKPTEIQTKLQNFINLPEAILSSPLIPIFALCSLNTFHSISFATPFFWFALIARAPNKKTAVPTKGTAVYYYSSNKIPANNYRPETCT
jgi:hypothetical protein